jgi:hypothetical protein
MPNSLTPERVRLLRCHAQGLHVDTAAPDVAQAIRAAGALQAQEPASAALAIRVRTSGLTAEAVRHAREDARSIVLTWTMRGTMHLVPAADVRWQVALLGERLIRKTARRYAQLDLDDATRRRAVDLMQAILRDHGPLTRAALATQLAPHGIPVEGQAIHHLVRYAALAGVICFGPVQDGDLTYVRLADWLPAAPDPGGDPPQVLAELARRYLHACGPATPHDLAGWSGVTVREAQTGFDAIEADLVPVETPAGSAWLLAQQWDQRAAIQPDRTVRLLPRYDNYLLGYRDRTFMVTAAFAKHIHPGGGLIRPTLMVDGQARGIWRLARGKATSTVIVQPFTPLDPALLPALDAEVQDIGRFLGTPVDRVVEAL